MKTLLSISFILLTLILVPSTLAQTPTPSTKPVPKREAVRTMIAEKKRERVEKLSAIRRERILNFSNKMVVRLEATIERFEKLISRIESRIAKIEENNEEIEVDVIKKDLNEAKQALSLVKVELTSLKENLDEIPDATDPKVAFEEAKNALKKIKEDLKNVHGMLVALIGNIKGLRTGNK